MAREAAPSMAIDNDGGIDEYVNTVMTIAESSGHGTVDAVVHRPPRDSEDKPRRQSRCAARCGEGGCASAACGAQRHTRAAVGAAGNHGARCCIARNAPDATAARHHDRATAANATVHTLIHCRVHQCKSGARKAALHTINRPRHTPVASPLPPPARTQLHSYRSTTITHTPNTYCPHAVVR
jgi:hypothetical protein